MRAIRLTLSYDGTGYCGWQIQPNGLSIQQVLTDAIEAVTGVPSRPVGSGRTDAGVHAVEQVAHFHTESLLSPVVLMRAINANLPEQIVVRDAVEVDLGFHACRDCRWKTYRYVYHDGPVAEVFLRRYCWKVHSRLNTDQMQEAAAHLVGVHDFRCFETEWPNRASSVRTIRACAVSRLGDFVYVDVEADGFLYNMVRAIAGSLFEVGRGKWSAQRVRDVLEQGDRRQAGPTAPAHGLFLLRVQF